MQRVGIAFDTYQRNTIKSDTRDGRRKNIRFFARQDTPVYKKFQDFMRCDDNKTHFQITFSSSLRKISCPTQIVTTKLSDVESNCKIDAINLRPRNYEEVDSCIVVHLKNASKREVKRALVATINTDVVVVLIYHFFFFKFEVLWVEMGLGEHSQPFIYFAANVNCVVFYIWNI